MDSRNVFDIFKGNTPFNHQKNNSEMNRRWLRLRSRKQLGFYLFIYFPVEEMSE